MSLCQPHGIADFRLETLFLQVAQSFGNNFGRQKKVEIFRVAPYPSMFLQGECAGHHIRNAGDIHLLEHFGEQPALLRRKFRRSGSADRQFLLSFPSAYGWMTDGLLCVVEELRFRSDSF